MKGTYKNSEYFGKIIRYSDDKSCFMRENSFELNDGDTVEGYIDNHRMFIVERKLRIKQLFYFYFQEWVN